MEQESYSCTLSLTSALDGDMWSTPPLGRFTPGIETRYPLYRRLDGSQDRSGGMRKICLPPGFDPRTAQPIASRYRLKYPGPHSIYIYIQWDIVCCTVWKLLLQEPVYTLSGRTTLWSGECVVFLLLVACTISVRRESVFWNYFRDRRAERWTVQIS